MVRFSLAALLLTVLAGLAPAPAAQCTLDKLTASDGTPISELGAAVAVSGDVALVGAPLHDGPSMESGAVYVYERGPTGWIEVQQLLPASTVPQLGFGVSVAVEGDLAVVGAPRDDASGAEDGAVHVFERIGGTWVETDVLVHSDAGDPSDYDAFGARVDLRGDTLIASSAVDSNPSIPVIGSQGTLYVFERTDTGWTEVAKVSDGQALHSAVGDGVLVVGDDFHGPLQAGAAYVYEHGPDGWEPTQALVPPDPSFAQGFGRQVAAQEGRIAIGSAAATGSQPQSGAVYVYERETTGWVLQQKVFVTDGTPVTGFGTSVRLDGERMVVGEFGVDPAARVFARREAGWVQIAVLHAIDSAPGDATYFSEAVALDEDVAVVGAKLDDDLGPLSGSAYVFSISGTGCPSLFAAPDFLSLASGGAQHQELRSGADHAGELYLLLGSAAGTSPGLPLGDVTLPLNPDPYFQFLLQNPSSLIPGSSGVLDSNGEALVQLALPAGLDPSLAGVVLNHAYLTVDATSFPLEVTLASIAQPLELKP